MKTNPVTEWKCVEGSQVIKDTAQATTDFFNKCFQGNEFKVTAWHVGRVRAHRRHRSCN